MLRGNVVLVNFGKLIGERPAVIVSCDMLNNDKAHGDVIVVPITSVERKNLPYVALSKGDGGLHKDCFAKTTGVQAVYKDKIISVIGKLPDKKISEISGKLKDVMNL